MLSVRVVTLGQDGFGLIIHFQFEIDEKFQWTWQESVEVMSAESPIDEHRLIQMAGFLVSWYQHFT